MAFVEADCANEILSATIAEDILPFIPVLQIIHVIRSIFGLDRKLGLVLRITSKAWGNHP